jgi:hypothetical protein
MFGTKPLIRSRKKLICTSCFFIFCSHSVTPIFAAWGIATCCQPVASPRCLVQCSSLLSPINQSNGAVVLASAPSPTSCRILPLAIFRDEAASLPCAVISNGDDPAVYQRASTDGGVSQSHTRIYGPSATVAQELINQRKISPVLDKKNIHVDRLRPRQRLFRSSPHM